MQCGRDQFLAAARFAFNQHGEPGGGIQRDLVAHGLNGRALPHNAKQRVITGFLPLLGALHEQGIAQLRLDFFWRAGLGDEINGAERARVTGMGFFVLPGQNQDFYLGRMRQQFGDQVKAFFGPVRGGR